MIKFCDHALNNFSMLCFSNFCTGHNFVDDFNISLVLYILHCIFQLLIETSEKSSVLEIPRSDGGIVAVAKEDDIEQINLDDKTNSVKEIDALQCREAFVVNSAEESELPEDKVGEEICDINCLSSVSIV